MELTLLERTLQVEEWNGATLDVLRIEATHHTAQFKVTRRGAAPIYVICKGMRYCSFCSLMTNVNLELHAVGHSDPTLEHLSDRVARPRTDAWFRGAGLRCLTIRCAEGTYYAVGLTFWASDTADTSFRERYARILNELLS